MLVCITLPAKAQYDYLPGSDASIYLDLINNNLKKDNNPLRDLPDKDKLEYGRGYCAKRQNGYTLAQIARDVIYSLKNNNNLDDEQKTYIHKYDVVVSAAALTVFCPQYAK
ncbi:hypothetical protein CAL7716_102620 (plasmid) [Calothrix sp. PCC 7716]|nr:hypothetical protein CAL7716_102620 [Calothrix sp. PCC 7716]